MDRGLKAGGGVLVELQIHAIAEETPTFYGRAFINLGNRGQVGY